MMAAIFVFSAVGKIGAPAMTKGYIAAMGLPFPDLLFVLSIIVELGGGLLLAFGLGTRITALGLAVFSIVTGLVFHHAISDQNEMFHLLKNLAMAGGLLQVVTFGAGAFSLDARKATNILPRAA
jgi:putative oxidoreductase